MLRRGDIIEKERKYHGRFPIVHGSIIPEASYREVMVLHKLVTLGGVLRHIAMHVYTSQVDILATFANRFSVDSY